jgi:uncharacterized oligopeptide transporter (OPT) family protein
MKLIVEGIMTAQLPWTLVMIGVALALFCFLANIPILAVSLGLYLPLGLSSAVFAGGLVRVLVEKATGGSEDAIEKGSVDPEKSETDKAVEKGILLASGLVAGDALMGIVIGIFAALGTDIAYGLNLFPAVAESQLMAFGMFLALAIWMYWYSTRKDRA